MNVYIFVFLLELVVGKSVPAGTSFDELISDNGKFALKIETEDDLLLGHLVLYQQANKVQLWHSDYMSTEDSNIQNKAKIDPENGDFYIYNSNTTTKSWTASLNQSIPCKPTKIELSDSGLLALLCNDATEKWSPDAIKIHYSDVPKPDPEPCFFQDSPDVVESDEKRQKLSRKCLKARSPKFIFGYGARAISFSDLKCGVKNASTVQNVETSAICWSYTDNILNMDSTVVHTVRFINEDFYRDYLDVRKKRFRARKLEIEEKWNQLYIENEVFKNANFESLIISEIRQPDNYSISGVYVTAFALFGNIMELSTYQTEWEKISESDSKLGDWKLDGSEFIDTQTCPEISTLQSKVPTSLWDASGLDGTTKPKIGTTINFKCPENTQLSHDNDGYHAYDEKFTILCSTRKVYDTPKTWPKCVNFCPMRIPYVPPSKTGLMGVEPLNTIPSGQFGQYRCQDTTLGVDRGPSEYFEVVCNKEGEYNIPKKLRDWPICMPRTTTMSPVLPIALKNMMQAFTQRLEFRLEAYPKTITEPKYENYWINIVLPVTTSFGVFIILILCISRIDSVLCKICEERKLE